MQFTTAVWQEIPCKNSNKIWKFIAPKGKNRKIHYLWNLEKIV